VTQEASAPATSNKDPERAGIKFLASETFRDRYSEFEPALKRNRLICLILRPFPDAGCHGKSSCSMEV